MLTRRTYISHPRYLHSDLGDGTMSRLRPTPFAVDGTCGCMCTEYRSNFSSAGQTYSLAKEGKKPPISRIQKEDESADRSRRRKIIADKLAWLDQQIEELARHDAQQPPSRAVPLRSGSASHSPERAVSASAGAVVDAFAVAGGDVDGVGGDGGADAWAGDLGTWSPLPQDERWYALRSADFSGAHHTYLAVRYS